jgi:hypothetical protein
MESKMATVSDAEGVERLIPYRFRDRTWLQVALTAADRHIDQVTGREVATEGNRKLAALGESLITLLAYDALFETDRDRGEWAPHLAIS